MKAGPCGGASEPASLRAAAAVRVTSSGVEEAGRIQPGGGETEPGPLGAGDASLPVCGKGDVTRGSAARVASALLRGGLV